LKFSICVSLTAGLLLLLAECGLAQSTGTSNSIVPIVTIRAIDPEAFDPGDNNAVFHLQREGPTNLTLNVFLQIGGTAANGVDYVTIPSWIAIPAGVRTVPILVRPIDDNLVEGRESVQARLVYPPIMPPIAYLIGSPSNAVVFIHDAQPFVAVEATDPHAAEPGVLTVVESGEFTITRSYGTNVPLIVHYSIAGTASNGGDYSHLSNSVVIPVGQLAAKVTVHPLPDNLPEPTETVVLRLELSTACAATVIPAPYACYKFSTPREAVVFIADNDPPANLPPTVQLTRPLDGQTFAAPARIPLRAVTVDPDGYVPHIEFYAGSLLIGEETRYFFVPPPPGQPIVYETIWTNPPLGRHVLTARATDNRGAEAVSPPVNIWVVRTNEPPVTNLPPVVTISAPDPVASEGTNCVFWTGWNCCPAPTNWLGTNTATFVVRRSGPTNAALTLHLCISGTASNGVDYYHLAPWVTIPPGLRAAEFKVVPIDDLLPERLESVVARLCVPPNTSAAVPPYIIGYPGRAAVVIVDNDAPRPATSVLSDRCVHITHPGANGTSWRIEWSANLVDWTPICTTTVTDGAVHFVDPDAEDEAQRYYRAVPEAAPPSE